MIMETLTSLPNETVITLGVHLLTLPVAHLFSRYKSGTDSKGPSRDALSALLGCLTVIICYRWNALQLFLQWLMSYLLLRTVPPQQLGKITFIVTYGYVLLVNAYKFIYRYGDVSIDYTGSMMLGTMRVTSLAFAIQDSGSSKATLTDIQRKHIIIGDISLKEHFNYYFSFVGILFGPFVFYDDHKKFINRQPSDRQSDVSKICTVTIIPFILLIRELSVHTKATLTLVYGLTALSIVLVLSPHYPVELNSDEDVLASGFLYKHWVLYITMFVAKCRYYFAWLTAQAVAIYAGYDANEDENTTATVNPIKIELTTSLKQFIDNWNIFTAKWLRYCCFERVPKQKALVTFAISALWHGFLPGYMIMFIPLAFYSVLGQKLHKVVRPMFQGSDIHRAVYALLTWVGAAITICFNGTGFQLLFLDKIWEVQRGLYFYPHILALLLFVTIPKPARKEREQSLTNGSSHKPHSE